MSTARFEPHGKAPHATAREPNRTLSHPDNPKKGQEGAVGVEDPRIILLHAWHSSAQLDWAVGAMEHHMGQAGHGAALTFGADGEGGVPQALG